MTIRIQNRQVALIKKAETEATYQLLQQIGIFGGENSDKVPIQISLKGETWSVNLRKIRSANIEAVHGRQIIQTPSYRLVTDAQISDWNNKVPSTRQITIDGVTQDLSADRTWAIGSLIEKNYSQSFLLGGM